MPFALQSANRVAHLLHGDAALHGVENPLRAAFRADPHAEAAQLRQRVGDRPFIRSARVMHSNGMRNAAPLHFRGIFEQASRDGW